MKTNLKLFSIPGLLFTAALLLLLPCASFAQTWKWHVEPVDQVGKFTSIATDKDGDVHLSYADNETIRYAFRPVGAADKWFTMQIDGGSAYTNLAVDAQGHPHICYTGGVVHYARFDGTNWDKQKIATDNAPITFSCAIAISPDGTPNISWYRERNADDSHYTHIKFAALRNGVWLIHTVDFDMQTGKWESMQIDSHGNPVLSFDAYVKGLLKFAQKDGDDWKLSTVDFRGRTNKVYDVGMGNSLAVGKDGKPRISYEDGEDIKFAYPDGDSWKVETIDTWLPLGSWVGYRTWLALDSQDHPQIVYDAGGTLKHAYWDGQKWHIEILAHNGFNGYRYCSIAIDAHDTMYVSYADPEDGSLKVAVGELQQAADSSTKSAVADSPQKP